MKKQWEGMGVGCGLLSILAVLLTIAVEYILVTEFGWIHLLWSPLVLLGWLFVGASSWNMRER